MCSQAQRQAFQDRSSVNYHPCDYGFAKTEVLQIRVKLMLLGIRKMISVQKIFKTILTLMWMCDSFKKILSALASRILSELSGKLSNIARFKCLRYLVAASGSGPFPGEELVQSTAHDTWFTPHPFSSDPASFCWAPHFSTALSHSSRST